MMITGKNEAEFNKFGTEFDSWILLKAGCTYFWAWKTTGGFEKLQIEAMNANGIKKKLKKWFSFPYIWVNESENEMRAMGVKWARGDISSLSHFSNYFPWKKVSIAIVNSSNNNKN